MTSLERSLAFAAAYSWRLLVVAAGLAALAFVLVQLAVVVLPVFLALFATTLLRPPAEWLHSRGIPRLAAALLSVTGGLVLLGGLVVLIVPPFIDNIQDLGGELRGGVGEGRTWLEDGPLGLSEAQIDDYVDRAEQALRDHGAVIATGVLGGARVLIELLAALALSVVLTFFFVKDGERIVRWLLGLFPDPRRQELEEIGRRSWRTLASYLRGVTIVALFDSVFIGLALVVIGVPAALPLAVFTFFGAYVPIVGAVVTGIAAVIVALIANGLVPAALVAAAVLIVQQVESNLLQPFVVGRAVAVHPIVILMTVMAGGILGGVIGAMVAVPLVAVAVRVGGFMREQGALAAPRGAS